MSADETGQKIMGNEVLDGVAVVWDGVHSVGAPTDDRDTLSFTCLYQISGTVICLNCHQLTTLIHMN